MTYSILGWGKIIKAADAASSSPSQASIAETRELGVISLDSGEDFLDFVSNLSFGRIVNVRLSLQRHPLREDDTANSVREEQQLADRLGRIRDSMTDGEFKSPQPNAEWISQLPHRTLANYKSDRRGSDLGQILNIAKRFRENLDRVVVLGTDSSCQCVRMLMQSCAQPYHNELSRGDRGSRPRLNFFPYSFDNDALQGLLHLLGDGRVAEHVHDRWGLVQICPNRNDEVASVTSRVLSGSLLRAFGGNVARAADSWVRVCGPNAGVLACTAGMTSSETFLIPELVDDCFGVFTAAGLLPAAILGLDVVAMLRGAAAMNEHFCSAPPRENIVLDFVAAASEHFEDHRFGTRTMRFWCEALKPVGDWCRRLTAHNAVTTASQRLRVQVVVDSARCNTLVAENATVARSSVDPSENVGFPELLAAAIEQDTRLCQAAGQAVIEIHLPQLNESTMGELLQMLILATTLERTMAAH